MKAIFEQGPELAQGYATVTLAFAPGDNQYAAGDGIAIGHFLGENDIQYLRSDPAIGNGLCGSAQPLKLDAKPEVNSAGEVIFTIQPGYVDKMEDGSYEFCLLDSSGKVKDKITSPVSITSLPYLPNGYAVRDLEEEAAQKKEKEDAEKLRQAEDRKAREEAEAARKAAEEAREAKKIRQVAIQAKLERKAQEAAQDIKKAEEYRKAREEAEAKKEAEERNAREKFESEAVGAAETAAKPQETKTETGAEAPETQGAKKGSKAPLIAAAIVILFALGGGAYWFMNRQAGPAIETSVKNEDTGKAKEAAKQKAAEEAARQAREDGAAREKAARADARGRVRAFFAGQRNVEGALKLAKELDANTPEQQDAIFRLYYYAAGEDSPEGSLEYAKCLDPALPAWGTIKKDGAEAYYYYGKSQAGKQAQESLMNWMRNAAASGNEQAKAWLGKLEQGI